MHTRQLKNIALTSFVAAALCACASEEVKKEAPAPAPVAAARPAPAPAAKPAPAPAAPQAPRAVQASKPAPVAAMPEKRSVYYDFDESVIKSEFRPIVEANAKYLTDNRAEQITVEGNCDERGSREYNIALGQRRADSVKSMLKLLGVPESRIETVSFGEEKPVAQGHDEASWWQNRRSDVVYKRGK